MSQKEQKPKQPLDLSNIDYQEYFKSIEDEYDSQSKTITTYFEIVHKKITDLAEKGDTVRGASMQMAEHMANAVTLIGHQRSLTNDKLKLKKSILEETRKGKANQSVSDIGALKDEIDKMRKERLAEAGGKGNEKLAGTRIKGSVKDDEEIDSRLRQFDAEEKEAKKDASEEVL